MSWGGDASWWAWLVMSVGMVGFWGLVVWGLVVLLRGRGDREAGRRSAEEILGERLARGEVDAEEYRERLDALRSGVHGTGTPVS